MRNRCVCVWGGGALAGTQQKAGSTGYQYIMDLMVIVDLVYLVYLVDLMDLVEFL